MRSDKYRREYTTGDSKKKKTRKKSTAGRIIKMIILALVILTLLAMIGAGAYAGYCIKHAPEIDTSNIYDNLTQSTYIYDDKGKRIDTLYSGENRTNVKYEDLPKDLINAFVALEDKTFWEHHGFNFIRIVGAIKNSVFGGGRISGTSTITQQLARNVYLPEDMSERTLRRKIVEAWYTLEIEHDLSKEQILEAYLNTVNLGYHSWGVQSAAESYFKTSVKDLTLEQCAALAPIVQAPSEYALVVQLDSDAKVDKKNVLKKNSSGTFVLNDAEKERREICLDLMLEQEYISKKDHDKAIKKDLKDIVDPSFSLGNTSIGYFTDYIIEQVITDLQEEKGMTYEDAWDQVYTGGLRIYSTMNQKTQKIVQNEFKNNANYPSVTNISYDEKGNILNKRGQIAMYDYDNIIKNKRFTFKQGEITSNEDGSITIKNNKRLHIYETEVDGEVDYSLEFPTMYLFDDYKLYSISGGYIYIPQKAKSMDDKGNCIISADFLNSEEGQEIFKKNDKGRYYITKDYYSLNQRVIQPQSAMTIIENKTGQIKAMVGGRKTTGKMLYNRAVQPRQPGSSIKPLGVYSAALQQSVDELREGKLHTFVNYNIDTQGTRGWGNYITAGSIVSDERTTNNGKPWPFNSSGGYSGRNTVRSALRNSINTCAYKIWMQVGVDYSVQNIKKFGITTLDTKGNVNDLNPSALALGGMTNGVTTLEMANAYTVFPNNGVRAKEPLCYTKVTDSSGKTVLSKERKKVRVLDPGVAWIMADMMKGVVTGGTGTAAYVYGTQAGGKTGTTSDQYDIWFDGFTPKYSAALWIGNDVNISLTSMSGYAAALWGKIMNQVPNASSGEYKDRPDNVEYIYGEYYVEGTYSPVYWWGYKKKKKGSSDSNTSTTSTTTVTTTTTTTD